MNFLTLIITWVNVPINALGKFLLAPVGHVPGWLSNTIISAVAGVVLLIIFKKTSNQRAIARIRDDIKANTLALKLFKDSLLVTFQAQGRLFKGALQLLGHAIVPLLVMIVPVSLLLAQMALWYQFRPLAAGEETLVSVKLKSNSPLPPVSIQSITGAEVVTGPVRVVSSAEIFWKIKGCESGQHRIVFKVNQQKVEKQLVVGEGFKRISAKRPGSKFLEVLQHPLEKPFGRDSAVQSVQIDYPRRQSWTSGTDYWLIYFFIAAMVFALVFKPFLKVRI